MPNDETLFNEINRLAREMAEVRKLLVELVGFHRDAESEIPESMRRFANYFHDVHDMIYAYEEHGQQKP